MLPQLVRYFDLSGAVDADPIVGQPARDAFGDLVTAFLGTVEITAQEVDADGEAVTPTVGLTVDIGVVVLNSFSPAVRPAGSGADPPPRSYDRWSRGPIAITITPGELLIQPELADTVGFQVVVTAKSASPAGRFLAIWAVEGPRT